VPNLVPPAAQKALLCKNFHRDLTNKVHKTNLHAHYEIPYEKDAITEFTSVFSIPPSKVPLYPPKDASTHKPLNIEQILNKKLRWMTLGGQYDWTKKVYPEEVPPAFPEDLANFLHGLFPTMKPEAAIVNLYSPGDTLSMHRDVSEESEQGLISLSIGCEAIFIVGLNEPDNINEEKNETTILSPAIAIRLRSGDVVYMSGPSRFAWHGVPKIIAGTCPEWLQDWPASGPEEEKNEFEAWRGWMNNKRINLNVRQMYD
jgi:alkylated DNA repair protein alkB family protein 1